MTLREMTIGDLQPVADVLKRNGLRAPSSEQWQHFWTQTHEQGRPEGIAMGWVLDEPGTGIVGTFRNVASEFHFNGERVRAVVASAWAVDEPYRRGSIQLAAAFFRQKNVDLLLNMTAVEETSGRAFLAFGAERVPQAGYMDRLLWPTGYRAVAAEQLRQRNAPAALTYPAALGMWMADLTGGRSTAVSMPAQIRRATSFDERFDRLWQGLRVRRDVLQAPRTASVLRWRFELERSRCEPVILVHQAGDDISGYAVLVRRDQPGQRRLEFADVQAVDRDGDIYRALLHGALAAAREDHVDLVAMTGHHEDKRRLMQPPRPHVKTAPGWPIYYKAINPALKVPLRSRAAWDLSLFDSDALWSGVFPA